MHSQLIRLAIWFSKLSVLITCQAKSFPVQIVNIKILWSKTDQMICCHIAFFWFNFYEIFVYTVSGEYESHAVKVKQTHSLNRTLGKLFLLILYFLSGGFGWNCANICITLRISQLLVMFLKEWMQTNAQNCLIFLYVDHP